MQPATESSQGTRYRIDDLIMDVTVGRVTRGDELISLSPLSFDLLLALTRAAPEPLSLDELMSEVWPGSVVSPETVSQRVKLVRDALGDSATSPRYVAGIRGRGYRLVAPVSNISALEPQEEVAVNDKPSPAEDDAPLAPGTRIRGRTALAAAASFGFVLAAVALWWMFGRTSEQPQASVAAQRPIPPRSVAVLPFENLSRDKNNAYFATGMQDLVLTKLADVGGLIVIARTSTQGYASHPTDLKQIGRELGVANILEGSVQKAGNQVLIDVQLINASTRRHVWAQVYQRSLDNMFGVEGEVAKSVAGALKAKLDPAEKVRVLSESTHNAAAFDAFLRGFSATNLHDALASLRRAVKLDPNFGRAWAILSSNLSNAYTNAYNFKPVYLTEAKQALDRAMALAPDSVDTQLAQGNYFFWGLKQYKPALAAYQKALQMSPNNAGALNQIGEINLREGHWQTAIDWFKRCLALNPHSGVWSNLGWSYEGLHEYAKAEEMFKRSLTLYPHNPMDLRSLATMYQSEGELAKASKVLKKAKLPPNSFLLYMPVVNQALYMHRYADAVRILQKAIATPKLPNEAKGAWYQYLGFAERLTGHEKAARKAYLLAIATLKQAPDSPPKFGMMALAQAALGLKDAALASGRRSMALIPATRDHFQGPIAEYYFAIIEAQVGDKAQAIAMLQRLLAAPPGSNLSEFLTPALLRLNPFWNPLRTDPAFKSLLAQYPAPGLKGELIITHPDTGSRAGTHGGTWSWRSLFNKTNI